MAIVYTNGNQKFKYKDNGPLVSVGKNVYVTKPGESMGPAGGTQSGENYLKSLAKYGLTDTDYNGGKPSSRKPSPAYTSPYSSQIDSLLDSIVNREDFSYSMDTDPLYQQYQAQYRREGDRAMRDTMGNAAALTGGYGSSYGTTAGGQAYDYHLSQLNDRVPELYALAYQKYQGEQNDLYSQLSAMQAMENQAYSKYRDEVGDFRDERNFDYGTQQDAQSQKNWQSQFDYGLRKDAQAQNNWQSQFDYGKQQDNQSQKNWQSQFNYGKQKDAADNSYRWAQSNQSQKNWQSQFDYGKQQDNQSQKNWQTQFDSGKHSEVYNDVRDQLTFLANEMKQPPKTIFEHIMESSSLSEKEKQSLLNTFGVTDLLDR